MGAPRCQFIPPFSDAVNCLPRNIFRLQRIYKTHLQIHLSWTSPSIQILLLGNCHYLLILVRLDVHMEKPSCNAKNAAGRRCQNTCLSTVFCACAYTF